ncbi:hypothetical protein B1B_17008, partial [mine drainage metagenome]
MRKADEAQGLRRSPRPTRLNTTGNTAPDRLGERVSGGIEPGGPTGSGELSDGLPVGEEVVATADPANIGRHLSRFAALSEPGPGVTRLAYTRLEREAHEVFAAHMLALGLRVWRDAAGNTLA